MKKIILAIALLVTTVTIAQNNLFSNISNTDHYQEYKSVTDADGDGLYDIIDRGSVVKFKLKYLPTGEGYAISAIAEVGRNKGDYINGGNAVDGNYQCVGYPFESYLKSKNSNEAFVAIDNYVFHLKNLSQDGTSYNGVACVYINIGKATSETSITKPKMSSMNMIKMLTSRGSSKTVKPVIDFGAEHKALESQNIDKLITNYLVTMKGKQNARTATQKQADNKIVKAKAAAANSKQMAKEDAKAARHASWLEAQKYNDSVKATPEWQEKDRRIKQNEANYQGAQKANVVTLRNTSGRTIYVGKNGSVNRGTEIPAGGTGKWDCDYDAYIQRHTIEGGSNAYRATNTKVYSKNTGCGSTVTVR